MAEPSRLLCVLLVCTSVFVNGSHLGNNKSSEISGARGYESYDSGDGGQCVHHCVCDISTSDRSKEAEYKTLKEMKQSLKKSQELLDFMEFDRIFDILENSTRRLNALEDDINERAVSVSVTELFALRKNINAVVDMVEAANSSSQIAEQTQHLHTELADITDVVNDLWQKNPYKQRNEYKMQLEELRHRFTEIYNGTGIFHFNGEVLPLDLPLEKGWCDSSDDVLNLQNPVTHKWNGHPTGRGMWFKDPQPLTKKNRTQIWQLSFGRFKNSYNRGYREKWSLNRYESYADFVTNDFSEVGFNSQVYGAIVYGNALYYNLGPNLMKLDLTTNVKTSVSIGFQVVNYKGSSLTTNLDLKVDEQGLWVIYSISSDKKIAISKLDPAALTVTKTWLTGIVKSDVCAVFMMCGKLYTIKSCRSRLAQNELNYVFDTATSTGHYAKFHVPSFYGDISQLNYNPRERLLFAWDKGHMVTYLVFGARDNKHLQSPSPSPSPSPRTTTYPRLFFRQHP